RSWRSTDPRFSPPNFREGRPRAGLFLFRASAQRSVMESMLHVHGMPSRAKTEFGLGIVAWDSEMTKFLLAAVSLLALRAAAPALAADMPAKASPPPVQAYQWTGFYAGVDFGGGWSRKCWDDTTGGLGIVLPASTREGCHSGSGGLAGGQIGYRWQ